MSALLDKLNSLPKEDSVAMEDIVDGKKEETHVETDKPVEKTTEEPKETATEPAKKAAETEEQEPPKTASKAEKDAYKARRVKAADDEKAEAKAEVARVKKENEDLQKQRDDWKRQAETVASSRQQPTQQRHVEAAKPAIDINKNPVEFLVNEIQETKAIVKAYQVRDTNNIAYGELEDLEKSSPHADYKDVMEHAEKSIISAMKVLNPRVTESQIRAAIKQDKIDDAVKAIVRGENPVDFLYNTAKTRYGYQPKAAPEPKVDAAKEKAEAEKARFDAVNKNKSKSATGLAAGGSTGEVEVRGPQTTKRRTLRDFSKLTKSQKDADYVQE